jgi:hypothetical protein
LRLERVGSCVKALCGLDGKQWFTVGLATLLVDHPIRVGLHAIGTIDPTN